ncbi:MAG: 2'-deoxycytidine 5'-triphosphate deaminase [Chloroflexi bacterium]|nr:2'-deoxycytidine 5'-triphosphate deaminase [Chloroflexota bacterium]
MDGRAKMDLSPGVLAEKQLKQLFDKNVVEYVQDVRRGGVDASAFDLTLGTNAWKLKTSSRPTTRELEKIRRAADVLRPEADSNGPYFHFASESIYLVELQEVLTLPAKLSGRATGKSTIGRLDVITRLLTTSSREYDTVQGNYRGPLYLLVSPQTFDIKIAPGDSLNQLRVVCGPQHAAIIDRQMVGYYGRPFWHVMKAHNPNDYEPWESVVGMGHGGMQPPDDLTADPRLFDLTVDLGDPEYPFIYKAIRPTSDNPLPPLDLRSGVYKHLPLGGYDPREYFERVPVKVEGADRFVDLDTGSFYIMKSKERLSIPSDVSVEVVARSERIGDIRIHYAGFAHPCFGMNRLGSRRGTPLIFEVRATDMVTRLFDHSLLAKIQLFRMSQPAKPGPADYDTQELKLSKIFAEWPES